MVARVSGPLEYSPLPEHSETKRSMLTSRRATELSLRESGCGPWQKSQPAASRAAFWGEPVAAGHQGRRLFLTQCCRRADYQKRGDEIMHSLSHRLLLWRRPKMKGPGR